MICANSIREHRCVLPCLKVLSETIQQHYGIFENTLASIVRTLNLKGLVYEDIQHVTSSSSTSLSSIEAHLKFLELLLSHSRTSLNEEDLNLLWTCCVVNRASEQKVFFVWFETMHRKRHVSPELVEIFLCTKMSNHDALCSIPPEGFGCFAYLFNFINNETKKTTTKDTKLIGFELLWRIVIEANDESNVVKPAIELLMCISEEKSRIHDCMRRLKVASSTRYVLNCLQVLHRSVKSSSSHLRTPKKRSSFSSFLSSETSKKKKKRSRLRKRVLFESVTTPDGKNELIDVNVCIDHAPVKVMRFRYDSNWTVGTLREKISSRLNTISGTQGFPINRLRLFASGTELKINEERIDAYWYSKFIVSMTLKSDEDVSKQQQQNDVQIEEIEDFVHAENSSAELLSSQYFDDLFALLQGFGKNENSSMIAHSTWRLIKKLPPSEALKAKMSRESSDKIDWEKILPHSISSYTGQYCYSYELLYGIRLFWNRIQDVKWCRMSFDEGAFDVLLNLITKYNPFVLNAKQNNDMIFESTLTSLQLIAYDRLLSVYEDLALKLDMFVEDESGTLLVRENKIFEKTSLNLSDYVTCALISVTRLSNLYSMITPGQYGKTRQRVLANVKHTIRLLVPTLIASKRTTEILGSVSNFKNWLNTHLLCSPPEIGELVLHGLKYLCHKSNFAGYLFDELWRLYFSDKERKKEKKVEDEEKMKKTSLCYFKLLCHILSHFQDTFTIDKLQQCLESATDCLEKCTKNTCRIISVCCSLVKSSLSSRSEKLESVRKRLANVTFQKCLFLAQRTENKINDASTQKPAMLLLEALARSSDSVRQDSFYISRFSCCIPKGQTSSSLALLSK